MDNPAKDQNNGTTVRIEISVDGKTPQKEHYAQVFYALIGCVASLTQKIGATNSRPIADLARDILIETWDKAPNWPEEAKEPPRFPSWDDRSLSE